MRKPVISAKKGVFLGVLVVLIWLGFLANSIWQFASYRTDKIAESIIVLGAAVSEGDPSPVFEERIKHAVSLYKQGQGKKLIFTGGFGDSQLYSESTVGKAAAISEGVPEVDILIEESSRTTQQNLFYAHKIMQENGLKSAIIVSDPLHMKRAMMMAKDLGIDASSSPTPTTRYKGLKVRLSFLLREIYFIHHYFLTGQ